jgi:hypothetical protein
MSLSSEITLTIEGKPVKVGVLRMGDLLNLQKWVKKAWAKEYPANEASTGGTLADRYRGVIDAVVGDGARLKDLPVEVVEKHLRDSRQAALGHMAQFEMMRKDSGTTTGGPPHFMTPEWGQELIKLDGGLEELAAVVLPRYNAGLSREAAIESFSAMDMEQGSDFFAACFGYADVEEEKAAPKAEAAPGTPVTAP